jgi:hypothetical protein
MMQRIQRVQLRALPVLLVTAAVTTLSACDDDPTGLELLARYEVEVSGETFVVGVTTPGQLQAMETRLASGEAGVISGELAAGDAGYNDPWSWHMIPSTVHAPDMAIEVCDGRPSMVEEDLDYWLETVERFCPWGATVTARLD